MAAVRSQVGDSRRTARNAFDGLLPIRPPPTRVGPRPDAHAPVTFSACLDATLRQSPYYLVLRCEGGPKTSIGAHRPKVRRVGKGSPTDFQGASEGIVATPATRGLVRRHTLEIEAKDGVDRGAYGATPLAKETYRRAASP